MRLPGPGNADGFSRRTKLMPSGIVVLPGDGVQAEREIVARSNILSRINDPALRRCEDLATGQVFRQACNKYPFENLLYPGSDAVVDLFPQPHAASEIPAARKVTIRGPPLHHLSIIANPVSQLAADWPSQGSATSSQHWRNSPAPERAPHYPRTAGPLLPQRRHAALSDRYGASNPA